MKKIVSFLLGTVFSICIFSQEIDQPRQIYFEGIVESETMYDGVFSIRVSIKKGELAGRKENLYFKIGFHDETNIKCKGTAHFDGGGGSEVIGRKIKGTIVELEGVFESHDTDDGYIKHKYYKPIELNWKS